MQNTRQLILHIGIPKTGSSAIQRSLLINRNTLTHMGIYYPKHRSDSRISSGLVSIGNGAPIKNALDSHHDRDEIFTKLDTRLRAHWKVSPTVLLSSEALWESMTHPNKGKILRDYLQSSGIRVKIVGYMRDIAEHSISRYAQRVERRGYAGSYSQYIGTVPGDSRFGLAGSRQYFLDPRIRTERLRAWYGHDTLHFFHYNNLKGRLIDHFYEKIIGVPLETISTERDQETVNRTLTSVELDVAVDFNRRFSPSEVDSRQLSDAIALCPPAGPNRPLLPPSAEDLAFLLNEYGEDVEYLQRTFPALSKLCVGTPTGASTDATRTTTEERESILYAWLHSAVKLRPKETNPNGE